MSNFDHLLNPEKDRCLFSVQTRDTYRIVRGKGFKLHYNYHQCYRKPLKSGYCKQHEKFLKSIGQLQ